MDKFEVEKIADDYRSKIVDLLVELFDERWKELIQSGQLYEWIKDRKIEGTSFEIQIDTCDGTYAFDFNFKELIKEKCYTKKFFGIFKKKNRFMDINLKDLIWRLTYFKINNYKGLVKDVIDGSKYFGQVQEELKEKYYNVELDYNVIGKTGCILKIS